MKIYPVVHMKSNEHALELSQQAHEAGADGVFLIDHLTPWNQNILTRAYQHVRVALGREAFIGVNYLSLSPVGALRHMSTTLKSGHIDMLPNAFWVDDGSVESHLIQTLKRTYHMQDTQYFGGVAFKYTPTYTDDPDTARDLAREYMSAVDVMTTSGPGTGHAAEADKVKAMREAIDELAPDKQLALASGVSVDNIELYRPYVDSILAASSVETQSYSGVFVESKLRDLIHAAHQD